MNAEQKIAVIVPVHNAGAFLRPCLDAIAAQTLGGFICVLLDDGSTDGSGDICAEYAARDSRFICRSHYAGGAAAARSVGLKIAKEQGAAWAAFCDADDLYHPALLQTLLAAATETGLPVACCKYDSFTGAPPQDEPGFTGAPKRLAAPAHLDALLHDHGVDYSLCNKLYSIDVITPEILDNTFAFNEDLLANWKIFSAIPGCAYCSWVGYHYRQHAASASHSALSPQSIDEQRNAALYIRQHAGQSMQASADAFYYEKLVYLASMILRREDAAAYRVQLNELIVGIASGLWDKHLGRNPRLPLKIRLAALATVKAPALWQKYCQKYLKDRQ